MEGTLAPPLVAAGGNSSSSSSSSIDVVFATYWFYPAKTRALLPEDQRCIDEMINNQQQRFHVDSESVHIDVNVRALLRAISGHFTPDSVRCVAALTPDVLPHVLHCTAGPRHAESGVKEPELRTVPSEYMGVAKSFC